MTKEEIKAEALKREKEESLPECHNDHAYRGVNSAYGMGFVDGAEWCSKSEKFPIDKQDIIYLLKGIEVPYELLSKMPNDIGYLGSCGHNDPCWCWKRDIESYSNYSEEQLFDLYCQIKQFWAQKYRHK